MEIKIKWIKRKQMTHENTYCDDTTQTDRDPTLTLYILKNMKTMSILFLLLCKKKPQNFWDHREQSLYHTLGFVNNVVKCQF